MFHLHPQSSPAPLFSDKHSSSEHGKAARSNVSSYLILALPRFLPSMSPSLHFHPFTPTLIVFIVPRSELLWEIKLHCISSLLSALTHTHTHSKFRHYAVTPQKEETIVGGMSEILFTSDLKDVFRALLWSLCGMFY